MTTLVSAGGGAAGEMMTSALRSAAPDSEAETDQQSSEPLLLDSDALSALLREPTKSSQVQNAVVSPESHSTAPIAQPGEEEEDAGSADYHGSSQFSHMSHAKFQQLLSWLTNKHRSGRPSDIVTQAPGVISSGHEQHTESEHTRLAQLESAQLDQDDSAPGTDAESEQTESEWAESCRPGASNEQMHVRLSPAAVLPGLHFFLLTAASLLVAWLVSSRLIRKFATPLTGPTALEAQIAHDEEEEQASPEAAHAASEGTDEEPQQGEQGVGLATRARSVARSMSEAVSALVTNQSEVHEVEEAGMEVGSAPGVSGAGTSRGGKPRGRRELAALGKCPQCSAESCTIHHLLPYCCSVQSKCMSCLLFDVQLLMQHHTRLRCAWPHPPCLPLPLPPPFLPSQTWAPLLYNIRSKLPCQASSMSVYTESASMPMSTCNCI